MGKLIKRLVSTLWNQAGMVSTLSGCSFAAVLAAVTGYLAKHTVWIASYGPIAWLGMSLAVACVALCMAFVVAHLRYRFAMGSAINKWKEQVDKINPLDLEFIRKRINISDLSNPVTRLISDKRFIDCELIGPINILLDGCVMDRVRFLACDVVPLKEGVKLHNVVVFLKVTAINCELCQCTIYIHNRDVDHFVAMGANFTSLTGRSNIDSVRR